MRLLQNMEEDGPIDQDWTRRLDHCLAVSIERYQMWEVVWMQDRGLKMKAKVI